MKFENRYYADKKMYEEYVNKVATRKIIVSCLIIFIVSIILLFIFKADTFRMTMFLAIGILALGIIIFIKPIYLKEILNLDFKLHNGERPETVVTFDDKITLQEGNQKISIDYVQIKKYYRLKRSSVLMFSDQNGIMFVEDNFTIGKKEDFEKFILKQCNNLDKITQR